MKKYLWAMLWVLVLSVRPLSAGVPPEDPNIIVATGTVSGFGNYMYLNIATGVVTKTTTANSPTSEEIRFEDLGSYMLLIANFDGTIKLLTANTGFPNPILRLGEGTTINSAITSQYAGSVFASEGYLTDAEWPVTSRGFVAFVTTLDLDNDPGTTGDHYGFLDITRGSVELMGYGYAPNPGPQGTTTQAIPEPTALAILSAAGLTALVLRRRRA